ncbi:MAG: hypothetical protein AAGF10_05155 [Verrucomicrobiota bacterium]
MKALLVVSLLLNLAVIVSISAVVYFRIDTDKHHSDQQETIRLLQLKTREHSSALAEQLRRTEAALEDVQADLTKADEQLVELEGELEAQEEEFNAILDQLLPPMVLPRDRYDMGLSSGGLLRKMIELSWDYNSIPSEDTEEYEIFANRFDELFDDYTPILLKSYDSSTLPIAQEDEGTYLIGKMSAVLALDETTEASVAQIISQADSQLNELRQEHSLSALFTDPDDPFSPESLPEEVAGQVRDINTRTAEQILQQLTPEQQAYFQSAYDEQDFLVNQSIITPEHFVNLMHDISYR